MDRFRKYLLFSLTAVLFASCGQPALPGFNDVVTKGQLPIEFLGMKKSVSPTEKAYEISLKNLTSDTIISFDYSMVRIDGGIFSGIEEKTFGGNFVVSPAEEFSILCRVDNDAEEFQFVLKSASWKETSSGALFRWDNKDYDEEIRQLRLKGS